jgi:hypothetical protein
VPSAVLYKTVNGGANTRGCIVHVEPVHGVGIHWGVHDEFITPRYASFYIPQGKPSSNQK